MTERLYIQEVQTELQYRDRRSVRRWCRNNNVQILSDTGSNKQYVLKDEFERAKYKHYHIRSENINSTMNISAKNSNKIMKYKPQGEYEKECLSIFTNLISTL